MQKFRRTYAVGDIHGDNEGFVGVLSKMHADGLDPEQDLIVFLGDYIDGFEYSAGVVQIVREYTCRWPQNAIALKGNHEQLLIDAHDKPMYTPEFRLWWEQGGKQTYDSYKHEVEPLPAGVIGGSAYLKVPQSLQSDIDWMRGLPTLYETDHYWFVHAGFTPGILPEETDEYERMWIRKEFLQGDWDYGKKVVHGHTPSREPEIEWNRINLNTRSRSWGFVSGAELFADEEPYLYWP